MSGHKTSVNVCVLRDGQADAWSVVLCVEDKPRHVLGRFDSRPEALSFALKERQTRDIDSGVDLRVVCPDDCPCYAEAEPDPAAGADAPQHLPVVGRPARD